VKEIFYTLQGEGTHSGRAAVFCRFAGCNLWSGREIDRMAAICRFCDTDFVGGDRYPDARSLVAAIEACWPGHPLQPSPRPLCVLTGGEPALQVDGRLVAGLRSRGFEVAIETNGTRPLPPGIHHVCVSPKAGATLAVTSGQELKLVFPQPGAEPSRYEGLAFERFYLSPMDGPDRDFHARSAARYCLEHPRWRLSLQAHKLVGLP
jgi:7-carboxy-7-deazaguanine synthase